MPYDLASALVRFGQRQPDAGDCVRQCLALLEDAQNPFCRSRLAGHFTASAWLVSSDGQRTLLTHHRKLGRWLQPGGHADGERNLALSALREAEEESGLDGLRLVATEIFDLDIHWIPAHAQTPGHWHHDVRYVVQAGRNEAFRVSDESLALAWRDIRTLAADPQQDASMRRMARRWLEFQA